ncbi:uncharacterized protein LOC126484468 isoform X1 [Schistocerca serialis cubense]|uniref:uncharacterized protein LOC126484468 isoform X1 n=1 Tax=Schistocerca serialis cubense TaxID=2023355 RepID=UPI00214EA789|nr:uncharacterized protein LOC126484468 isoform X1 [Schistocerca serialis cubense]
MSCNRISHRVKDVRNVCRNRSAHPGIAVTDRFASHNGNEYATPPLPLSPSAASGESGGKVAVLSLTLFTLVETTLQPRAPNFQYFERPKYRYPYYDEQGRGRLLYGYGGSDLYQYKAYSPLEGIH